MYKNLGCDPPSTKKRDFKKRYPSGIFFALNAGFLLFLLCTLSMYIIIYICTIEVVVVVVVIIIIIITNKKRDLYNIQQAVYATSKSETQDLILESPLRVCFYFTELIRKTSSVYMYILYKCVFRFDFYRHDFFM